MRVWAIVVTAACGGGDKEPPDDGAPPFDSGAAQGVGSDGSAGTGGSVQDSMDSAAGSVPMWLSWEGEESLTVDLLADGSVECTFAWRTSGLHRSTLCEDCLFDFDVVGVVDDGLSTCSGAAGFRRRRWWIDATLYDDDGTAALGALESSAFTARAYTLEIDSTYGAPVAMTWTISATLR